MQVLIENYKSIWASAFKKLNEDWLKKYFVVEPYDHEVLSNPETYILDKGGQIYFVTENGEPKGTVSLMYNEYGELEMTKMGVDESTQGKGYGNLLIQHCIQEAERMGADDLILYSNTLLEPAIHLYRKFGFEEVPVDASQYKRCNIKMIRKLSYV